MGWSVLCWRSKDVLESSRALFQRFPLSTVPALQTGATFVSPDSELYFFHLGHLWLQLPHKQSENTRDAKLGQLHVPPPSFSIWHRWPFLVHGQESSCFKHFIFCLLISDIYNWSMLLLYLVWKQSSTLLLFKKNVCICVFLCRHIGMCGYTCVCIPMYMCLNICGGQDTTSGIILRYVIYLPMRQGLSLACSLLFSLNWLVGHWAQRPSCLWPSSASVTRTSPIYAWHFNRSSRDWTRSSWLQNHLFHWLSFLSSQAGFNLSIVCFF